MQVQVNKWKTQRPKRGARPTVHLWKLEQEEKI